MKVRHGLVAFFDILGFRQFAAVQNDDEILSKAQLTRENLLQIRRRLAEPSQNISSHHLSGIECYTFADSILLSQEIPANEPAWFYWLAFFHVCTGLMKFLFNQGFPLRGAISEGKFHIEERSFVGKPIIDCHEQSGRTLWAGCIVVPAVQEKLDKIWKIPMEQVCVEYGVPVRSGEKSSSTETLFALKWFHDDLWRAPVDTALGIPNAVRKSFEAHGKKILNEDIRLKMENTVKFLTFVDGLYANSNKSRRGSLV